LLETEGEKMSSSLGNYFYVADALDRWGVNVLRTFYLGTQYGTKQTFSEAAMREAEERWERLERTYEDVVAACDSVDARTKVDDEALRAAVDEAQTEFRAAMNDDFNVREAMAALLELSKAVNRHLKHEEYDYRGLKAAVETFEDLGGDVFGLELGASGGGDVDLAGDLVELVLQMREEERAAGDYDRADALRDELEALGVEVGDSPEGPTYRLP
jgi:cysteinyl-tRNA synthetase